MSPPPHTGLVKQQLEFIARHIPTTYFIAVVDADGLPVVAWKQERYENDASLEEDRITAMSAAMSSLGERIVVEMQGGTARFFVVQGEKGIVFHILLSENYILTFGVRELQTIDITLVILQQWWDELLALLEIPAPELYG